MIEQLASVLGLTFQKVEGGRFAYGAVGPLADLEVFDSAPYLGFTVRTMGGRDPRRVKADVWDDPALDRALQDYCGLLRGVLVKNLGEFDRTWMTFGQPVDSTPPDYPGVLAVYRADLVELRIARKHVPASPPAGTLERLARSLVEACSREALPVPTDCSCGQSGAVPRLTSTQFRTVERLCEECWASFQKAPRQNPVRRLLERTMGQTSEPVRRVPPPDKDNPVSLVAAAQRHEMADRWEEALECCRRALELDPRHQEARELCELMEAWLAEEKVPLPPEARWLTD